MDAILVALIGGLCVAIPNIITTIVTNKNQANLIKYRIDELDAKVNKHNNLIERMYSVEARVTTLEDKVNEKSKKNC